MDESTREQWNQIAVESIDDWANTPDRILGQLRALAGITNGFAVDQLTHVCQTAARAERAGADKEVVVAALCHDMAKAVSEPNHPAVAAALLKPYVRDDVVWMVQVHQDFQGRHYYGFMGKDPEARRAVRRPPRVRARRAVRRRVGPDLVRPGLRHPTARALRAAGARDLQRAEAR